MRRLILIDEIQTPRWCWSETRQNAWVCLNNNDGSDALLYSCRKAKTGKKGFPHRSDLAGWKNWFTQLKVNQLDCYVLDKTYQIIITAAIWAGIDIRIFIDHRPNQNENRFVGLFKNSITQFVCAGSFLANRLILDDVAQGDVHTFLPTFDCGDVVNEQSNDNQIQILALADGKDSQAIGHTIWSTAMIKHIHPEVKLVINGQLNSQQKATCYEWESRFAVKDMIEFVDDTELWPKLLAQSTLVLNAYTTMNIPLRLMYSKQVKATILLTPGDCDEYIESDDNIIVAESNKPRDISTAMLPVIDKVKAI